MRLSLRIRMTVWFVAAFVATAVLLGGLGLLLREAQVGRMFDERLEERADLVMAKLMELQIAPSLISDSQLHETLEWISRLPARTSASGPIFAEIRLPQAGREMRTTSLGDLTLFDVLDVDLQNPPPVFTLHRKDLPQALPLLSDVRVSVVRRSMHGEPVLVLIAAGMHPLYQSLNAMRFVFAVTSLVGIVAASIAGYLSSGPLVRRIQRVTDLAGQITPEDLDRRVKLDDGSPRGDEVSVLAERINAMLDRIQQGYQSQERFIHNASHELRTPISVLYTEAQLLRKTQANLDEHKEFANSVEHEMQRLARLVDALLLLTRARSPDLVANFTDCDLHDVVEDAIDHCQAQAHEHEVPLRMEGYDDDEDRDRPCIKCDRKLLEVMAANLIRNAIRFNPPHAAVIIRVELKEDHGLITVEDEGPGLPAETVRQIFDRFHTTPDDTGRRGTGLGLAMANTIAQLHGGEIHVENKPNRGARFIVRLPMG